MALSITKLFGATPASSNTQSPTAAMSPTGQAGNAGNDNWTLRGYQAAGQANGNLLAFSTGFQSAFTQIKQSQANDQQLQQKIKDQLDQDIIQLNANRNKEKDKLTAAENKLDLAKQAVNDKRDEIAKLKTGGTGGTKTDRLNFRVGVGIITFLTLYLFLFYSSTAYSAFFRNFNGSENLMDAMFDGMAIPNSFKAGLFEGCFILFMPFIFLALGFVAYNIGATGKGFGRYVKTVLLYTVTFLFDCLLAYKISKTFYDMAALTSRTPMPPYSIQLALKEGDFWIVIFCGFVVYVIWGLIYDYVMQLHSKLTSNDIAIKLLQQELSTLINDQNNAQVQVSQHQQAIAQFDADIDKKEKEKNLKVRYNTNVLKQDLQDYEHGWVKYFAGGGMNTQPLQVRAAQEWASVDAWIANTVG